LLAHKDAAAGLSAVQIGELYRIFIVKRVDLPQSDQLEIMINPIITFESQQKSLEWEGCMSINSDNQRLYGPVQRSKTVEVAYFNEKAEKKKLKATEFFSHLIQHELDHLNGILFLSYVKNPKNIWKEEDLDAYIDKHREL